MDESRIGELNPDGTVKREPTVCAVTGRPLTRDMATQMIKLGGGKFVRTLRNFPPGELEALRGTVKSPRKAIKEES